MPEIDSSDVRSAAGALDDMGRPPIVAVTGEWIDAASVVYAAATEIDRLRTLVRFAETTADQVASCDVIDRAEIVRRPSAGWWDEREARTPWPNLTSPRPDWERS